MKMKVVVVISIFGAEEGGTIWAMCVCWDNWFTVHNMDAFQGVNELKTDTLFRPLPMAIFRRGAQGASSISEPFSI